ncbi:ComEA family DNA-binding protein [Prosthecobacter sp.]|uniref:ComEA family DNA-binding protein n=1 Tax=Prosthecobacter sp. TaxID=1965333 RepID=UPI003783EEAF
MKFFISLLVVLVLSCGLSVAQTAPKSKAPAKPSAKVEAVAKTMTDAQKAQLLNLLNEGDDAALMDVPGIGEVRAAAIKKARPFAGVTDVLSVSGIGEGTFAGMVEYTKAGFKKPAKKSSAKAAP